MCFFFFFPLLRVAQTAKNLPAMQETWVQPLDQEDLEKGMATHSNTLAWRIPWMKEPGGLQSMGLQRVGCLLRNLYAGQEGTIRTGHGLTDWFQIMKGVHQGYMLSPYLFNLYAEYIMRNARLDEAQAGIKIAGRNINNLRYADNTTLMAESKEELKSPLMKVREEREKVGLKLNVQIKKLKL